MLKVEFDEVNSSFLVTKGDDENVLESTIPYNYIPNCKNILPNLKDEGFDIILLSNPFLHKEVNWFKVKFDDSEERGGFLFPISLLESDDIEDKYLLSYMFVAYRQLLSRISEILTGVLSDSYPYAYILAIHKPTKPDFHLSDYVLSLAFYGFYNYKGGIDIRYPKLNCIENLPKNIRLKKASVDNIQNSYVNDLVFTRLFSSTPGVIHNTPQSP